MSMEHKAYLFDHASFDAELKPILLASLASGDVSPLRAFIHNNRDLLVDPYEGETLDAGWESGLTTRDVDEYGDFALTKYYRPNEDLGVGRSWESISDALSRFALADPVLLGSPVQVGSAIFDPGKMGSYFQEAERVRANLELVRKARESAPDLADKLADVESMFERARSSHLGLYVTF